MKKTILITLLILITAAAGYTQSFKVKWDSTKSYTDTLAFGDTLDYKYEFVYVTVKDTGATYTDSLVAEVMVPKIGWTTARVLDINDADATGYTVMSPGAGQIKTYLVWHPFPWAVRVRRVNTEAKAGIRTDMAMELYAR
jgi:hypothetical protein